MGPVKGFDRSLVKLKQQVADDPSRKFPVETLKDLTRCSFTFINPIALSEFIETFKANVANDEKIDIFQIKNMFLNLDEAFK